MSHILHPLYIHPRYMDNLKDFSRKELKDAAKETREQDEKEVRHGQTV